MARAASLLVLAVAILGGAPNRSAITRLDGSGITGAQIDQTVARLMLAAEVTGTGIGVIDGGKIAYLKAYGFWDKEKQLPLTEQSVMAAASLTKSAVAYMVMQLVEQGKISLDTPVTKQLPKPLAEYPEYRDIADDPRHLKITPRMLLSHTSGLPNFRQLNRDGKLNINFEPGSRYAYSGEDLLLLQFLVETITHKPIAELMGERVFAPLGMTRTSMISEARFDGDVSQAYDEGSRPLGVMPFTRADAAGSMHTTLSDFAGFMLAVAEGRGLKKSTKELMLSPQVQILSKHQFPTLDWQTTEENKAIRLSYGLGWGLFFTPYGRAFFKEGHFDQGFRHYAVMFDQQKKGLVILTNSSNGEGMFKELIETLLGNTFTPIEWEGYTPYNLLPPRKPLKSHKEITLDPKILERYVGRYSIPGVTMTVTRQAAHLFFQENDEPMVEIFAEGEFQFFSKVSDDEATFEGDAGGKAATLVIHADGRRIPLKRAE
jgi:CubicO group peptidase (beta-lactamase class C family)